MKKAAEVGEISVQYPYCHYVAPKVHTAKNEQVKKAGHKGPGADLQYDVPLICEKPMNEGHQRNTNEMKWHHHCQMVRHDGQRQVKRPLPQPYKQE